LSDLNARPLVRMLPKAHETSSIATRTGTRPQP
jgi:hypothetical protein